MKKYLAIFLTLVMMFSLVSCGDTPQDSSEPSDSISDTDEKITESFPLITDEINLDSSWECDYLKIDTCSKWKEESEIDDDKFTARWGWSDEDFRHSINISLSKNIVGKKSQSDLQEFYEGLNEEHDGQYEIFNNFMKNGQAYIITGSEDSTRRTADFYTDNVKGSIHYSAEAEEIVMKMIESIEFY